MKLKKLASGRYSVVIQTPHGQRSIPTSARNIEDARRAARQANVVHLENAARAGALNEQTIARLVTGRRVKITSIIPLWIEWLRSLSRSPSTLHNSELMLRVWAREQRLLEKAPTAITPKDISDWVNNPKADLAHGSRGVQLSVIRSFFAFCAGAGYTVGDPAAHVKVAFDELSHDQKEGGKQRAFSDSDISSILSYITRQIEDARRIHSRATETYKRTLVQEIQHWQFWYAATILGRETGLRLSDITCLEWASVDLKESTLTVWTRKRDRRVALPITATVRYILTQLPQDSPYVFPKEREIIRNMTKRSLLSQQFKRLCAAAGVEGHSFHDSRHTHAAEAAARGEPRAQIQRNLGHSSPVTTDGYIDRHRGKE